MNQSLHTFHIPVMGLAYTIDTPVKVAKFGISSVVSIIEDELLERMREVLCRDRRLEFVPVSNERLDYRSARITAYLNLLDSIVKNQTEILKNEDFENDRDINQYFELLPESSDLKALYRAMQGCKGEERVGMQEKLKAFIRPGNIDVNIMTKLDKTNYDKQGQALDTAYSDAHSALKGYADSTLASAIVFSAGLNPRLFAYCQQFPDFFPAANGEIKKKIILKVSDYRSALIQGKFLAKKGLWVSEFRVESGINCGGHAFIADGVLLGPILEEFKMRREELREELFNICNHTLIQDGRIAFDAVPDLKITAQGGIGTAAENSFLLDHYRLDATGWGSPFLMVPEATNVDDETLDALIHARQQDYYLSHASPLGVPFNNFRNSSSEKQRLERIAKNRPGSPCYKKFLSSNTEFTERPICTASRVYQDLKIKQLKLTITDEKQLEAAIRDVTEKDCLCEGLGATALLKNGAKLSHKLKAVTICPGPNLAYFSGVFTLHEMVDHIYGRTSVLNQLKRPHVFVNELQLYVDHLKQETEKYMAAVSEKQQHYLMKFRENLLQGINYYHSIAEKINAKGSEAFNQMNSQLDEIRNTLSSKIFSALIPAGKIEITI